MSTEAQSDKKRPTHRVFAVTRRNQSDKGFWADIGAAWAHADGKGFSLKLEYLPLNGGDIVVRADDGQNAQSGGAQ